MSQTYKNNAGHTVLGIEPGETGVLDDAAGYVGPGALELVEAKQTGDVPGWGKEIPVTKLPQPIKAPPTEAKPDADGD